MQRALHPMRSDHSDLQAATDICSDLRRLVPLGVLFFYGLPASGFSLANTTVCGSDWFWFDASFLTHIYGATVHPAIRALAQLVECRCLNAVYKSAVYGANVLWKIRVYAIPSDIEGSRFIRSWRSRWFRNTVSLQKKIRTSFLSLLCYLDFSADSWQASFFPNIRPSQIIVLNFSFQALVSNLHHHMRRWVHRLRLSSGHASSQSLDDVLQSIYKSIETPDLSAFSQASRNSDPCSPEFLIRALLGGSPFLYENGLSTELYRFQIESLCKMYEKESFATRSHVSHFMKLTSPSGQTYYYDTIECDIYNKSELMTIPRGGILAEDMGLGKTLICLALICLTKYENSSIPENLLLHHQQQRNHLRSLFDIAKTSVVHNLFWKYYVSDLPHNIAEHLNAAAATFSVDEKTYVHNRARRHEKTQIRTLHLCSTTLIVVPDNIIHQWIGEIEKHLCDSSLKKLFICDKGSHSETQFSVFKKGVPNDVQSVISFDLVLVGSGTFSKMSADPDNALSSIYWKRLIIDEGHSLNSGASNLSLLCKSLYAERRWAVSGTPTSGLTNLQMEDDTYRKEEQGSNPKRKKRKYVVKSKFNSKEDLRKLGNLVTGYFQLEPFASQSALWNKTIVKDLLSPNQFAAKNSLITILNSLMVRHSQPQVEKDIQLPPLHHEAIFLEPSYHNKLAINLFTSVLAVNAVTSERVGSDYMFDASNKKQLRTLVNNLQLSTFYWTGFKVEDVKSLLGVATDYLNRKTKDGKHSVDGRDRALLEDSIHVAETALRNSRWRISASIHEMQYLVENLPASFAESYAIGRLEENGVYGGPQLVAAQRFFYKNRFKDSASFGEMITEDSAKFWMHYWQDSEKKNPEKFSNKGDSRSSTIAAKGNSILEFRSKRPIFNGSHAQATDLRKAQITGTASAKLSYLICKLSNDQREGTKSIVFFDFEDHAYFLTEAMDILGMEYLLYATFIDSKKRADNLNSFSARATHANRGVCLIMDLKLASHGLNIIAATKVYFINPVWQKSVEAQAIKRAHRIGQTNEVHVETLILKGTLEEEIYHKRSSHSTVDPSNKHVIDDEGIRTFVLRHDFLRMDDAHEYSPFNIPEAINIPEANAGEIAAGLDDGFSLPSHSKKTMGPSSTQWKMHLFTPDSLQKISEIDARNASKNFPVRH